MNTGFLGVAVMVAILALILASTFAVIRLLRGPSLLDRVVASDLLAAIMVGLISVTAIDRRQPVLIDVALALGLIAFVATVAFARFLEEGREDD